jgi:hypothetical protein
MHRHTVQVWGPKSRNEPLSIVWIWFSNSCLKQHKSATNLKCSILISMGGRSVKSGWYTYRYEIDCSSKNSHLNNGFEPYFVNKSLTYVFIIIVKLVCVYTTKAMFVLIPAQCAYAYRQFILKVIIGPHSIIDDNNCRHHCSYL